MMDRHLQSSVAGNLKAPLADNGPGFRQKETNRTQFLSVGESVRIMPAP